MSKLEVYIDRNGVDEKLKEAFKAVESFQVPFELIKESWFKGNRSIFALSGPGKFADLTSSYKKAKQRQVGFVYPILRREGTLYEAMTQPGSPDSISKVVKKGKALQLGVDENRHKYFRFLAGGTKRMKARPYVLLGVEQTAPAEINNRVSLWKGMIIDYVTQRMEEVSRGV